jgi:hypothetical protein
VGTYGQFYFHETHVHNQVWETASDNFCLGMHRSEACT